MSLAAAGQARNGGAPIAAPLARIKSQPPPLMPHFQGPSDVGRQVKSKDVRSVSRLQWRPPHEFPSNWHHRSDRRDRHLDPYRLRPGTRKASSYRAIRRCPCPDGASGCRKRQGANAVRRPLILRSAVPPDEPEDSQSDQYSDDQAFEEIRVHASSMLARAEQMERRAPPISTKLTSRRRPAALHCGESLANRDEGRNLSAKVIGG